MKKVQVAFLIVNIIILCFLFDLSDHISQAQVPVSPTPNRVQPLPSPTSILTQALDATPTPTFTPQAESPVELEVLEAYGTIDVHFSGNLDSERVGTINVGERYTVLGVYFRWIQIQFDPSPDGTGWVFDEYVLVDGDLSTVRDFTVEEPTVDPLIEGATQTWQAIELTPGGFLTVTAESRIIEPPSFNDSAENLGDLPGGVVLPTFTYPANIIAQVPTQGEMIEATPIPNDTINISTSNGIAPIVPILVLAGLGIMGLLISSVRR